MRAYRSPAPGPPARPRLAPARISRRSVEPDAVPSARTSKAVLLREIVAHLRQGRTQLRDEWVRRIIDAYGPAANRIATTVAAGFGQERERVIREQQEAIRELSTPVLPVRERLLILPIIGLIDAQRARQLTEQLLRAIRSNRAKVVVIDITGVPAMDANVANHLVRTVDEIGRA